MKILTWQTLEGSYIIYPMNIVLTEILKAQTSVFVFRHKYCEHRFTPSLKRKQLIFSSLIFIAWQTTKVPLYDYNR